MPTQQGIKFLTKADAAHWFQRSERSLSRDITHAIKAADQDVLAHVRLQLEDGTVRPGTDISIDEIIRLRDDGQNPTWELEVAWLESHYGKRGDTPQEEERGAVPGSGDRGALREAAAVPRELPVEPELRLAVMEALNSELEKRNQEKEDQIRRLETELDRRAEERREENELQKQNNVLMQQIYKLLSNMQESSGELGAGSWSRHLRSLPAATDVDAEDVPDDVATAPPPVPTPKRRKPPRKRQVSLRRRSRPTANRKSPARKRSTSPKKPAKKPPSKPPRKLLPTLDRAVRSFFGR